MKNIKLSTILNIIIFIFFTPRLFGCKTLPPNNYDRLFERKSITILITDSGLGGLSICAETEQKLTNFKGFENVNIIFFNALPDLNRTYNEIKNEQDKIIIFENALESMINKFKPDLILIACNTLSVLYPKTKYFHQTNIPIIEIVNIGVDEIYKQMNMFDSSHVLICGTETTINSKVHKNLLIQKGIDSSRILNVALKYLESEIQIDPKSETVEGLIELYLSDALENHSLSQKKLFVALCCTHYGYSEEFFRYNLKKLVPDSDIINPNSLMSEILLNRKYENRYTNTDTNVKIYSRVLISEQECESIANAINEISSKTADALINYIYDENLFSY